MPRSSSSFTRVASVNRGGGWVKCWAGVTARHARAWPSSSAGSRRSPSSSSGSASPTSSGRRAPPLAPPLHVHLHEAGEAHDHAGGAEGGAARRDVHRGGVEQGGAHLGGHEPV